MGQLAALFSFKGRLRRLHWWVLGLAVGGAGALATLLCTIILFDQQVRFATLDQPIAFALRLTIDAIVTWSLMSLTVRRAHDIDWPAWPFVGFALVTLAVDYTPSEWLWRSIDTSWLIVGFILSLAVVAILGFMDGTPGPNRHGPSPKSLSNSPAFSIPGGLE